ncbi:hypothetical protein TPAU25S_02654 [Tsukamurella paurometabola]
MLSTEPGLASSPVLSALIDEANWVRSIGTSFSGTSCSRSPMLYGRFTRELGIGLSPNAAFPAEVTAT